MRGIDGLYDKFCILCLGYIVSWDALDGLETGLSEIGSEPLGNVSKAISGFETRIVMKDEKPDFVKLGIAKSFILGSNLPEDLKSICSRRLQIL